MDPNGFIQKYSGGCRNERFFIIDFNALKH